MNLLNTRYPQGIGQRRTMQQLASYAACLRCASTPMLPTMLVAYDACCLRCASTHKLPCTAPWRCSIVQPCKARTYTHIHVWGVCLRSCTPGAGGVNDVRYMSLDCPSLFVLLVGVHDGVICFFAPLLCCSCFLCFGCCFCCLCLLSFLLELKWLRNHLSSPTAMESWLAPV